MDFEYDYLVHVLHMHNNNKNSNQICLNKVYLLNKITALCYLPIEIDVQADCSSYENVFFLDVLAKNL